MLPILFGLIIYDCLPAQMPIHWNIAGEIDNYASKEIFVFYYHIDEWNSTIVLVYDANGS
ncbi:MAG: DUF1648 domain-containing protein [Thomasclavelia ramosa]